MGFYSPYPGADHPRFLADGPSRLMATRRRAAPTPDAPSAPAAKSAKRRLAAVEDESAPPPPAPHSEPETARRRVPSKRSDVPAVGASVKLEYRGRERTFVQCQGKLCKYCRFDMTEVPWTQVDKLVCDVCNSSVKFYYSSLRLPKAEPARVGDDG